MARILDYVSAAELERFENQDFFDEDERERLLPPKKPRGRPRKGDGILPSFSVAPIGEETSREQSLLPDGSILVKKRRGRPKGSFRKNAVNVTSTKPSVLSVPSNTIKKPRGRPPRQKNLSVVIPAFNGPQPQHLESTPGTQSEDDAMLENPKPQYSMMAASGLGQTDSEDLTSRDQSVELMPSLKKRRLNTENASIDSILDDHDDYRSSTQPKRVKAFSDMSPDPIADDSMALLRQFQARVYGPDHFTKSSSIPHRQGKLSLTNEEISFHTARSSLNSSSSDLLVDRIPSRLERLPKENVPLEPLPGEKKSQSPPANVSTQVFTSHIPSHQRVDTSPIKSTSPSKSIRRKISLTPHFPPSLSSSRERNENGSVASSRSHPSVPPANRHIPPKPTKPTLSQPSSTQPSITKNRNPSPQPQRRNPPSQSFQASSSTSKLGFAGLPRAKHITDYFAPKPTPAASNRPPIAQPRHSPSSQLLGPTDSNNRDESDSEDQLARDPSPSPSPSPSSTTHSDSDSISSEVVAVRLPNRTTTTLAPTTVQATRSQEEPSPNHHDPGHETDTDTDSSEDEDDDDDGDDITSTAPTPAANPTAITPIVRSTYTTTNTAVRVPTQSSAAESLNRAFELDDDDDNDEADGVSDTKSDSLNSEVMIIRPA